MMMYLSIMMISFILMTRMYIQPMWLGMMTLFMSMTMSIMMTIMMKSWFSFILILIYIGGMLIMIFYIITISPNSIINMIKSKDFLLILSSIFLMSIMMISFIPEKKLINNMFNKINSKSLMNMYSILIENNKLIFLMMIIILLIIMITIVKLCFKKSSSMRSFS